MRKGFAMQKYKVWDPLVRIFHWSLVVLFAANALVIDGESDVHEIVGFIILGLIVFRLVWGIIGPKYAKFRSFPPDPVAALGQASEMVSSRKTVHLGHSPLGALMIYNLIATILAIAVTGWMMTTVTYWGVDWVEELHKTLVNWAEISIVVHIAAVLLESRRTGVNLPGSMVTGYKTAPASLTKH